MKSLSFLAELHLQVKDRFNLRLVCFFFFFRSFGQSAQIKTKSPQKSCCSLSPDHIHGEPQSLLHAVGLTLRRGEERRDSRFKQQNPAGTGGHHHPSQVYLRQLDGFIEFVQRALQIRQLGRTFTEQRKGQEHLQAKDFRDYK